MTGLSRLADALDVIGWAADSRHPAGAASLASLYATVRTYRLGGAEKVAEWQRIVDLDIGGES